MTNIYFIQAGGPNSPIKIGQAKRIQYRLKTLQTAHYESLSLLYHYQSESEEENKLHQLFKGQKIRGEWFYPEKIIPFISHLRISRKNNCAVVCGWCQKKIDRTIINEPSRISICNDCIKKELEENEKQQKGSPGVPKNNQPELAAC